MRVLICVSPKVYREALAFSLQSNRPELEVRATSPEDVDLELAGFRPHLFVHDDAAAIPEEVLAGVPCRVEMPSPESTDARISAGGTRSRVEDVSTEDLLRTVAVAETVGGLD